MGESPGNYGLVKLEERLGVAFRDKSLALRALTHKSAAEGAHEIEDNQRLEFLGDAVLQLAVSHILYCLPNSFSEGELTRFRSFLVNREALIEIASDLQIHSHLRIGRGVPRKQPSVSADSVEAILGALFLDQSFSVVHQLIERLVSKRLERALAAGLAPNDCKSRLQEYSLAHWNLLPRYDLKEQIGDNPTTFHVQVLVGEGRNATGTGHSKKAAEQAAAQQMLNLLSTSRDDD